MPSFVRFTICMLPLLLVSSAADAMLLQLGEAHNLLNIGLIAWGIASGVGLMLVFAYNRTLKHRGDFLEKMNAALDRTLEENTRQIIDSNERLKSVLNAVPSPVYYKDSEGIYLGCNDAFAEMILGLEEPDIIGKSLFDLPEHIPEDLARKYHEKDQELIDNPGTQFYEAQVKCSDGQRRDFFFSKATIQSPMGSITGLVGVMLDITKRKQTEKALMDSQERTRSFQDASFGAIIIHDQGKIIDFNKNLTELTGLSPEELLDKDGSHIIAREYRAQVRSRINSGETRPYDAEIVRKDGSTIPIEIKARIMPYQGRMVRVAEIRDISERKRAEQEMQALIARLDEANEKLLQLSTTDPLTTLYCKSYMTDMLEEELEKSKKKNRPVAVVMADIDNFRHINEKHGKAFGDRVLQKVSQAILKCVREMDFVGRFGGDEFLMVLPETSTKMGGLVAERIRLTIQDLSWNTPGFFVTLSMGIAAFRPEKKNDPLKQADKLLSMARKKGGNTLLSTEDLPADPSLRVRSAPPSPNHPGNGSPSDASI